MDIDDKIIIICPVCTSELYEHLLEGQDNLLHLPGKFSLVRCKICCLTYINPQPTQKTLSRYYESEYPGNTSHNLKVIARGKGLKKLVLSKIYFSLRKKVINHINRLHPLDHSKTTLLDVGCGNGGFLYVVHTLTGVKGDGLEMDSNASEFARKELGFKIYNSTTKKQRIRKKYDIITMFQYLEHDLEPNLTLQKVRKLINEDGLLIIEVPNINSLSFKLFGSKWFNLDIPRHVYHYSPKTLTNLLEINGFEVVRVIKYPYIDFVNSLFNKLGISRITQKILQMPIYILAPLYYLPENIINKLIAFMVIRFYDTDIMSVYARPLKKSKD
jgi:SAM-dependent methyltransferase